MKSIFTSSVSGIYCKPHRPNNFPETDEVEIDFILDRHYWGRGFATEAGQAALQYGFNDLGLSMIVGIVHPENRASQRVLEKVGLQFIEETEYFGMACYRFSVLSPIQ